MDLNAPPVFDCLNERGHNSQRANTLCSLNRTPNSHITIVWIPLVVNDTASSSLWSCIMFIIVPGPVLCLMIVKSISFWWIDKRRNITYQEWSKILYAFLLYFCSPASIRRDDQSHLFWACKIMISKHFFMFLCISSMLPTEEARGSLAKATFSPNSFTW